MKKFFPFLAFSLLLLLFSIQAFADNRNTTVYIAGRSSSAYRYHKSSSCPGLSRSNPEAISLADAAGSGYTACSRCHPPIPDFEVTATPKPKDLWDSTEVETRYPSRSAAPEKTSWVKTVGTIILAAFAVPYLGLYVYGVIVVSIGSREERKKKKR